MYIPKNKTLTNQYTNGGQYLLATTGENYVGYYHVLFNNKKYTGKFQTSDSIELNEITIIKKNIPTIYDNIVKDNNILNIKTYNNIPMYQSKPTLSDYENGFMLRYFSKRKNNGIVSIQEISADDYYDVKYRKGKYDYNLYNVIKISWIIVGSVESAVKSDGTIRMGVVELNARTLERKESEMSGISKYLSNTTEFIKLKA